MRGAKRSCSGAPAGSRRKSRVRVAGKILRPPIVSYKNSPNRINQAGLRPFIQGINAAISSRASNIGFAVPINGATAILPQLRARGRVARGYVGVALREIDGDLQRSLHLPVDRGAFVQDVTKGSPAERAGLRAYDIVTAFEGAPMATDDELIHEIASRAPGATVQLRVLRDTREFPISVKLTERPGRDADERRDEPSAGQGGLADPSNPLGLTVRELDAAAFNRLRLPAETRGVLITRVDPLSATADSGIARGAVLLEINRRPILSAADYKRIAAAVRPGDVLALYLYSPDAAQRQLKTVRLDDR